MLKVTRHMIMLCLMITVGLTAFAQQTSQPAPQKDYVENTGFKGKIFELKYRDPTDLSPTIQLLGSGFKGATISSNRELKTITVRDFPENIAIIEEAIKRLDVPPTPRSEPNVEIHMHLLLSADEGETARYPAELNDVLKQLRATLSFSNYRLITSVVQRVKAGNYPRIRDFELGGKGYAEWTEITKKPDGETQTGIDRANYDYSIYNVKVIPSTTGPSTVVLENLVFGFGNSRVKSNLEVRDGEKVVVGTAGFGNRAMILVLTAKIIN